MRTKPKPIPPTVKPPKKPASINNPDKAYPKTKK